jgi:hypothetical protein
MRDVLKFGCVSLGTRAGKQAIALHSGVRWHAELCGIGMYTPAGSPLVNFAAVSSNVTVDTYGFNDLSCKITGGLYSK